MYVHGYEFIGTAHMGENDGGLMLKELRTKYGRTTVSDEAFAAVRPPSIGAENPVMEAFHVTMARSLMDENIERLIDGEVTPESLLAELLAVEGGDNEAGWRSWVDSAAHMAECWQAEQGATK